MTQPHVTRSADEPAFVKAILSWRLTWFVARAALCSAYLVGGLAKASDWPAAVAEQAHLGMKPAGLWAALTIAVEVLGPALILSGRLVWLGAGMLAVFTLLAAIIANAFWTMPAGSERLASTNAFFEHLGLVGGFVAVALVAVRQQPRA